MLKGYIWSSGDCHE